MSLNDRALNKTTKRRQLFRWLNQQNPDVIFLQETYSSPRSTKKLWEAEWGGNIVESHGSSHSRGVMILFKPNINVSAIKTVDILILSEVLLDEVKDGVIFVNICMHRMIRRSKQIHYLRGFSNFVLNSKIGACRRLQLCLN